MLLTKCAHAQVIWRLDTGARTYLPRLAGAVTHISAVPADAAAYVLTQADNTIRMVSAASTPSVCPTCCRACA